jgi:hypothetical protein
VDVEAVRRSNQRRGFLHRTFIDIADRDTFGTSPCEFNRQSPADAGTRTGNHADLAFNLAQI